MYEVKNANKIIPFLQEIQSVSIQFFAGSKLNVSTISHGKYRFLFVSVLQF